ncbi:hypothetical protein PQX77_001995, partial [Marasmius sp. AFHP31]
MSCSLTFFYKPGQLTRDVDVMLTFEVPDKEVEDDFAVWHVAKLKSNRGSLAVNQFSIDYSGRLGFGVGQVNTGRVLTPSSMVEVKPGQFTVLTSNGTDPIWSNPTTAGNEDGIGNSMRVTNNTGRDQTIAFGAPVSIPESGECGENYFEWTGTIQDSSGGYDILLPTFWFQNV